MTHVLTIAKRELTSLFFSPIAYVVLGVFGFGTALIFSTQFIPGAPAEMRTVLGSVSVLMIFLVPASLENMPYLTLTRIEVGTTGSR